MRTGWIRTAYCIGMVVLDGIPKSNTATLAEHMSFLVDRTPGTLPLSGPFVEVLLCKTSIVVVEAGDDHGLYQELRSILSQMRPRYSLKRVQ